MGGLVTANQRCPPQKGKALEHILVTDTISSYMESLETSFHIIQCRKRSQGKPDLEGREQPRSWVLWGKACAGGRTLAKLNPGLPALERLGERFNQCLKRQVEFMAHLTRKDQTTFIHRLRTTGNYPSTASIMVQSSWNKPECTTEERGWGR